MKLFKTNYHRYQNLLFIEAIRQNVRVCDIMTENGTYYAGKYEHTWDSQQDGTKMWYL